MTLTAVGDDPGETAEMKDAFAAWAQPPATVTPTPGRHRSPSRPARPGQAGSVAC